jgi:tagatose-1,6-bisphosphate aldolase
MIYLRSDRPEANRENLATLRRVIEDFAPRTSSSWSSS